MGVIVEIFEDVGDAIGDVFEAVGDVVQAVGDFVVKAVETVATVVENVLKDPIPTIVALAGQAVGIPYPVTMGAITAARGGDLEDIALSMGTAYLGSTVGGAISSTVSSTFIEAGVNETFSNVAASSISKGLVNGTIAEVRGGSFEDGFAGGFVGGMVAGGVQEVGSYVKDDVILLAQESGLDLNDATSLYNAGTRAVSAGVTSEVTGRGDFATSFANSAIVSSVDYGSRELNESIDKQFKLAATNWDKEDDGQNPIDTTVVGQGIPGDVVGQVAVGGDGVDATPFIDANVLADSSDSSDAANQNTSATVGETATSDVAILPEEEVRRNEVLTEAPAAENVTDFASLLNDEEPESDDTLFANAPINADVPESVIDIAEGLPTTDVPVGLDEPKGALTAMAEAPINDLDTTAPAVVSEAPVAENLLTAGLAQEKPEGGLNAVSQAPQVSPEQKMASSMGLKPTDFTKPLVATVGNLLKQTLTQPKRQAPRAPVPRAPAPRAPAPRPTGALQMAQAPNRPMQAPPAKMDVAKLIPIQKATRPAQPSKTLASNAKLTPVSNIANLTSLVRKTG